MHFVYFMLYQITALLVRNNIVSVAQIALVKVKFYGWFITLARIK